jgi:hypothetical protein
MSLRLKFLQSKWKREKSQPNDNFVFDWCESLFLELQKRKRDKEFTIDLIDSAVEFFNSNFTDQQKADCFLYVLGKIVRK